MRYHDVSEREAVEHIMEGIRECFEEAEREKAVIGLSGGIDSSLTATLVTKSIGNRNVIGLIMPSGVTKEEDVEDASKLAEELDIRCLKLYIQRAIDSAINILPKDYELNRIVQGNTAARIRMITLYNVAQMENALVVGTGNKSELLTGYFTKYGDGGVDLLPIGDLYKTEVWELAEYLKLPERIINKKPSAGLWKGQTDEEELGITYRELDEILYYWETNQLDKLNVEKDKADYVLRLVEKSAHKRRMPNVIKI
jgi:NAD+ synthase